MKRIFVVLAFVLTACLLLSACDAVHVPTPSPSNTEAVVTPTPVMTPAVTPEPTSQEDDYIGYDYIEKIHEYLQEYYADQIEEANKYRIKVGDTLYYLDTNKVIPMDIIPEFPLYRLKDGDDQRPEYLGTTGFSFKVFGDYIYVQSDPAWEDWPDYRLTRIVDLKDLSVTQAGREMYIYTPKEGNKVYYTKDFDCIIYVADASLKNPKKLQIKIPDKNAVDKKVGELYGEDISYLSEDVGITNVENGWIYFYYWMFEYEGDVYYKGNYRIKTDGSKIERIGEGKYGDEIEIEEG